MEADDQPQSCPCFLPVDLFLPGCRYRIESVTPQCPGVRETSASDEEQDTDVSVMAEVSLSAQHVKPVESSYHFLLSVYLRTKYNKLWLS